jgi:hypothetical protein
MAGILVPILPITPFDFSFLLTGTNKTIVLQPALNVTEFYYGRLIVRIHEIDMNTSGTPSIEIGAYNTDPSDADPRDFALTTSTLSVSITGVTPQAVGSLVTDTDTDLFPWLKIYAKGTQGTASGGRIFAVLSADLLLREP